MNFEKEVESGFKPRQIHPRNMCYDPYIEKYPEVYQACERFRDFYGGAYSITQAEADIRSSRLPQEICDELKSFALKDKFLLLSFLPNEIVAALMGEKKKKN